MTLLQETSAEDNFRAALERLKLNEPRLLPKGTPVTQNNVAKEAGCDRTALKKSRFPGLVAEIQSYVATHAGSRSESQRQKLQKQRQRNRTEKEKNEAIVKQRDTLAGLLNDANMQIAILTRRFDDLEGRYNALKERCGQTLVTSGMPKSKPRAVDINAQKSPKE